MPDRSMKILDKMLDVAAYRQKILASNVANADTPNYKAKDISFQKEMNAALEASKHGKAGGSPQSYEIYETTNTMQNMDGNTVNLDIEMAKVAENALIYNTAVQLKSMKIRILKSIIK